jgi:aspartate aminotransferase
MTMHSATLAINERLQAKKAAGERVLHLGFGEAGLPVPPNVVQALASSAAMSSYGPVAGSPQARQAVAGWFTRRGLQTDWAQTILAPGSKALLFALLAAIPGDVVLPRPSWVSYAAQAALLGKDVVWVPIPEQSGGIPDPDLLEEALRTARAEGKNPTSLVMTVPDNPTGTVAVAEDVAKVCAIAERHGLAIISDEIYASMVHDGSAPSPISCLPERTVITNGLSKSMALGGWRIGFARTPNNAWGRQLMESLIGIGSEVWSGLAAPMQAAAAYVLADEPEVLAHIEKSCLLHARVVRAVYSEFRAAGAACRPPKAGFYLYPDFAPVADGLELQGIGTGSQLSTALLERFGVGVLPGIAFGDDDKGLRVRVATSLLYGVTDEERWAALNSDDPTSLPWIASSLAHLRGALTQLTGRVAAAVD